MKCNSPQYNHRWARILGILQLSIINHRLTKVSKKVPILDSWLPFGSNKPIVLNNPNCQLLLLLLLPHILIQLRWRNGQKCSNSWGKVSGLILPTHNIQFFENCRFLFNYQQYLFYNFFINRQLTLGKLSTLPNPFPDVRSTNGRLTALQLFAKNHRK
jgi:hypothetical protein